MFPHSRPLTTSPFPLSTARLSPSPRFFSSSLPVCVPLHSVRCTRYIVHDAFVLPNEGWANWRFSMLSGTNHGHTNTRHQHHQSRLSEIDINIACGDGDARYLTKRIITQIMGGLMWMSISLISRRCLFVRRVNNGQLPTLFFPVYFPSLVLKKKTQFIIRETQNYINSRKEIAAVAKKRRVLQAR
ncbi:hypothetical protein M441DRAFT_303670 [Trichoderma asperellum CBS 433.97]|uniref:Uncharacterized protein n=1 Tax=Trichoderma asperellum (strain ATCC 204424 / CBS 433.97 / NBRC 101777) TaxID=1042311 RepID=A0A2T3ZJM0_TRIA4|nr:hypothetical protein M441DRAFT_303670 [Trichoderma asperellum CBS 433.97]PTB45007.1 hypothetical protein M441DRAFT_303670 [Trichoderma asperellum CBS 433.97]